MNAAMNPGNGLLAKQLLDLDLPLQVCACDEGFYIGTHCPRDGPISRESQEYFPTREAAQTALETDSWTQLTAEWLLVA